MIKNIIAIIAATMTTMIGATITPTLVELSSLESLPGDVVVVIVTELEVPEIVLTVVGVVGILSVFAVVVVSLLAIETVVLVLVVGAIVVVDDSLVYSKLTNNVSDFVCMPVSVVIAILTSLIIQF